MTERFENSVVKRELAAEFAKKMSARNEVWKSKLSEDQYNFFTIGDNVTQTATFKELYAAMRDPKTIPSEFLDKKMRSLFDVAITDRDKDVILYFADRLCEYTYSTSFYRRSFRRIDNGAYALKLTSIIRTYSSINGDYVIDAPIDKVLNREIDKDALAYFDEYSWRGYGYTAWQVAYALDHHDIGAEDAVRRILTEENNSYQLTSELIRGVIISHRAEFHELIGKLLLAARLQEGLRQIICESADCGTREGFLCLLKVIADNNLIRFSSVKRAVGTWLGIMTEDSRDLERVSEKSLRLVIECLEDPAAHEKYLSSEDAMELYIALWSIAFDDLEKSLKKIVEISKDGTKHQLLVAGYFADNMDMPHTANKIAKEVIRNHHEKEDVLAVWLASFFGNGSYEIWNAARENRPIEYGTWFDSREEVKEQYGIIKKVYSAFSGKSKTFSPCVFPWYSISLKRSDLAEKLCSLAAISADNSLIDEACGFIKECDANSRPHYFSTLLRDPKTETQRWAVLAALADKETYTRKAAYGIVKKLDLSEKEYMYIEDHLRFKSSDIRQYVISTLQKQNKTALIACIRRLLENSKEDVRLGALDMLVQLKKDDDRRDIAESFEEYLIERISIDNLPSKEKILLESLVEKKKEGKEESAMLFSPEDKYIPTESELDEGYTALAAEAYHKYFPDSKIPDLITGKKEGFLEKIKNAISDTSPCKSAALALEDVVSLSELIEEHKTDAFIAKDGESVLLGNVQFAFRLINNKDDIPFKELWKDWVKSRDLTGERLVRALVLFNAHTEKTAFTNATDGYIRTIFGSGFERGVELPYSPIIGAVLTYLVSKISKADLCILASALTTWFIKCVPDDMVMIHAPTNRGLPKSFEMAHLLAHKQIYCIYSFLKCENAPNLKHVFPLAVASAERCAAAVRNLPKEQKHILDSSYYYRSLDPRCLNCPGASHYYISQHPLVGASEYLLAAYQKIITEEEALEFLMSEEILPSSVTTISAISSIYYEGERQISQHNAYKSIQNSRILKKFIGNDGEPDEEDMKLIRFVAHIYDVTIPVIISSELSRGDSPTKYTKGAANIARIYGSEYLARILEAMGNDTLDRTAYHGWSVGSDRKSSLSHLLSVCIPGEGDSAYTLRSALQGKKISDKRLIEAALYSPEWIPIIGEYLGIDSFASVCYYFMAHMNERFDDKRKAMIARFTPLTDEELNLGAFDVNWFKSAYESVGEKTFNLIYDSAKYIADGAKHTRARKYADAALGKLTVAETEAAVSDKRNKDLLMAYSLIPLTGEDDICRRYLYIQKFQKESKKFGSQRASSEAKAAEMALTNLATNAGYSDTMRLTLRMETKVIDDSRDLLEEQVVDGVHLKITLDENGKASLIASKDGKVLKSIPAALKKNEKVMALTAMTKTLVEQYRRTRLMLERAMEDCVEFTHEELISLTKHPVVEPMLRNLVLVSGNSHGFIHEGGLLGVGGDLHSLAPDAMIKIAHPHDLYRAGCWRDYQSYLYEKEITQPYRQIFRELYVKTEEEMDMLHTLRYAGNQIQPAKTVSVLKGRRWVADVENGLQKIYYKENIVAEIYALADWFSPADIEAPTLEWVVFTHRKTGAKIKIADVPDIIFSEVMRDVDLAVSVAHAGGVDPETSHSTMEMRAAIISHLLPMLRIENVELQDRHAIINGKLADYTVHLGSGVVHQIGGAMIPILPVHSQHKGRIFLPFVDDDPKTAEIISKILLLTEDQKIKDPMILSAIKR